MLRLSAFVFFVFVLAFPAAFGAVVMIHQGAHNMTATGTFPLKVVSGVLTTQGGTPYFVLGDAPQAANILPLCSAGNTYALCAPGGVLSSDTLPTNATFVAYAKDRQAQGFNSLWINITCEQYTRCNNAGATQEGTYPFSTQLSGSVMSGESCPESTPPSNVDCWDMSTAGAGASAAYWTHIDGYFKIAAQLGMQVLADPIPTDACSTSANGGSFAYMLANNYVNAGNLYTKITSYANFLANRYKTQPNIIWFLGNDYDCFETLPSVGVPFVYISQIENSLFQFASTLKSADPNHLITLELNGLTASLLDGTGENGGATNAWSTVLGLNGTYANQGPPYDAALMAKTLNSSMPVLFVEGDYQGEDIGNINDGSCTRTGTAGTPPVTICNANFGPFLSAASHCGYDYISGGDNSAPAGDPNSCAFRERVQFWDHTLAGGAAGYVDGNHYTWTFDSGWPTTGTTALPTTCHTISVSNNCLDTAANAQLKNGVAFVQTVAWYKLVPDVTRSGGGTAKGTPTAVASPFVTGCYGTGTQQACANAYYIDGNHSTITSAPPQLTMQNAYPVSGVASDGTFGMAYVPGITASCNGTVYPPTNCSAATGLSIIVNNAVVNSGTNLTAVWYDPTTNSTTGICSPSGTPCNSGSQTYTTPGGAHADGTADWVLLVTGQAGSAQTPSSIVIGGSGCSGTACSVPNIDDAFANNVTTGLPPSGTYVGTLSTALSAGTPPFSGSYSLVAHVGGDNCGTGTINNAPFQISSDQLQYNTGATAGTTYNVCVKATVGANSTTKEFAVTAHNVRNASTESGCTGTGASGSPWRYQCIQTAVNNAASGDTIFLAGGNWGLDTGDAAFVTINKQITLLGVGSGNTVDTYGHVNNASGTTLCPVATPSTTVTCVYQTGAPVALFPSVGSPAVGGWIRYGQDGTALGSQTNCANENIAHIFFDGSPSTAGGDYQGLLTLEGCAGPITVTDLRTLSYSNCGLDGGQGGETQIFLQSNLNATFRDNLFGQPTAAYNCGQALQTNGENGETHINDVFWQGTLNPITHENLLVTGSYTDTTSSTENGEGPGGCGIDLGTIIGGCPFNGGNRDGSFHFTYTNNYFNSGTSNPHSIGPSVNDPNTSGNVSDLHFVGNWMRGTDVSIDACVWYMPSIGQGGCTSGGMSVNMGWNTNYPTFSPDPTDCTTVPWVSNGFPFEVRSNTLIGSVSAELNAFPQGTLPCYDNAHTTQSGFQVPILAFNYTAHNNYLQGPSNQWNTNASAHNSDLGSGATVNFCATSGAGTVPGCATSGFTTPPTCSITLGNLYHKQNGTSYVPITNQTFTAQYGAVQWLASTSQSTQPSSGDARWSKSPPNDDSFIPPASLVAAHGNPVYVWVMDSNNQVSAAACSGTVN